MPNISVKEGPAQVRKNIRYLRGKIREVQKNINLVKNLLVNKPDDFALKCMVDQDQIIKLSLQVKIQENKNLLKQIYIEKAKKF